MNHPTTVAHSPIKGKVILLFIWLLSGYNTFSQDKDLQKSRAIILEEALQLYKLEKASWHSTDILLHDNASLLNQITGYLSYSKGDTTNTIFWNKAGQILLTIGYDSIANEHNGIVNASARAATSKENDLMALRNVAFEKLRKNEGNFFTFYERTSPNFIPIITPNERIVFILTGSNEKQLCIGNDYKLWFNEKNEIIKKAQLHKSLIPIGADNNSVGTYHSHVLADQPFMTSTDICTFLLYKDILHMSKHTVISDKYTSIFNADNLTFIIVPRSDK
ncbi:hypothetical protein [Ohtaekwangia sp.]|uniref:hypothetical protein n=1 Tax=Ohtaekwangia sp. TaxID=2066019 RepID=UPI002FDE92C3